MTATSQFQNTLNATAFQLENCMSHLIRSPGPSPCFTVATSNATCSSLSPHVLFCCICSEHVFSWRRETDSQHKELRKSNSHLNKNDDAIRFMPDRRMPSRETNQARDSCHAEGAFHLKYSRTIFYWQRKHWWQWQSISLLHKEYYLCITFRF